jgi:hypothetical protein
MRFSRNNVCGDFNYMPAIQNSSIHSHPARLLRDERGSALLLALLVLAIFSLLGLVMTLEAVTGLLISDNYESRIRAECASIAGINHAQALMRGLSNDALLRGPDGSFDGDLSYLEKAAGYAFRNPLPIVAAQSLDIADPEADLADLPDDGLINTGSYPGSDGIALIPLSGIAQKYSKPGSAEEIVASRYLVKVTDNNGDASEKEADPGESPFTDGDGEVIVRSMGLARTFSDFTGTVPRKNSVVVYEGRFRRFSVFDFGSALLVVGSGVLPSFSGAYEIDGGSSPGIGVIDADGADMAQSIGSVPLGDGVISGAGLSSPSILDLTPQAAADPERSRILDAQFLRDFVESAPAFSDNYFVGDQSWGPANAPDLGRYDPAKPLSAPEQDPKVTLVQGDLEMRGDLAGGGLLIVTGAFRCLDACRYDGLILVIGSGHSIVDTVGPGISGGLVVANLVVDNAMSGFGSTAFSFRGSSRIRADSGAVEAALSLVPPVRTGFREIAGVDP